MDDTGSKALWSAVPWRGMQIVMKVLVFGATKYSWRGWEKIDPELFRDAMLRHAIADATGERLDPETGLPHIAHVACNCLMYLDHLHKQQNGVEFGAQDWPEPKGRTDGEK